ncbi:MAG TPA: hypothetical protein IAB27_00365 [Candidatus Coprosoma intestinipullorum]|uniref:Lipoprotein n=1 Tax=Candidatus Coprosoma intestinipullorum TaxID=2840752 RepID=A0A9D0ZPF4_9FIRM|nr:hypothetical protein [Candidatus Coprosoma intestinipullorum]
MLRKILIVCLLAIILPGCGNQTEEKEIKVVRLDDSAVSEDEFKASYSDCSISVSDNIKDKNNNYLFMCNVYMNNGDVYSSSMRIGTFTKMNLDMDCNKISKIEYSVLLDTEEDKLYSTG